ncbi:hypothetical protein JKF63_03021 [Porcisia hertigi]|uniref:Uncharacterized protein n=1 Tax=Porcisia hertigi TaxID=2761500 RepID=A0A836ING8_9TRYP|nr:hypothetical protein JKF63_03021 [Porcisia hertigi]
MSAHDSSAVVLIAHMNDIERQRCVLNMNQREQEAKIAFATSEKEQLVQAAKAAEAEEALLKEDLEALATEQQQLELQKMESTDRLRKTQAEEALHTAAMEADLQVLTKEKAQWQERAQELESLRRSWAEDAAMLACITALRLESEQVAKLKSEKTSIEDELAVSTAALEKMRAEQHARLLCARAVGHNTPDGVESGGLVRTLISMQDAVVCPKESDTDAAHGTAETLEEEIKRADYEATQATARHARTVAALQREVDALSTRAGELHQLLTSIQSSWQEVVSSTQELQHCRESGLCRHCLV